MILIKFTSKNKDLERQLTYKQPSNKDVTYGKSNEFKVLLNFNLLFLKRLFNDFYQVHKYKQGSHH